MKMPAGANPADLLGQQIRYVDPAPAQPWLSPFTAEVVGVRVPLDGADEVAVLLAGRWRYVPLEHCEPAGAEVRS